MSSASARVGAMHMAISSPTWRTLSATSAGWTEDLKPGSAVSARIGWTPVISAWLNTRERMSSGMSSPVIRACATGLLRNAT